MQGFLITLLGSSVAMSIISLVYMAALPLLSKRYAAKWLYYCWLLILIGWVLPFRPQLHSGLLSVTRSAIPTIVPIGASEFLMPIGIVQEASRGLSEVMWRAIASVWLIGMIVVIAFHVLRYWRFVKLVNRWSEDAARSEIVEAFQTIKAEMKIGKRARVRICPGITTPMLIGFIRDKLRATQVLR